MYQNLKDIGDFIFVSDPIEGADAIFIPGGSNPELAEVAAQLYHQGYAPLIVPSGGVSVKTGVFPGSKSKQDLYPGPYVTELDFLTDVLIKNGVPKNAILGEDQAGNTMENAIFTKELMLKHHIDVKKVILVCKSFHARRARMYYEQAFPNVRVMAYPFVYYEKGTPLTKETWTQTERGIKRVLGEVRRIGDQFTDQILAYCQGQELGQDQGQGRGPSGPLAPPAPSPTGQLHHIEIYVSNLKQTLDFYNWLLPKLGYSLYQSWESGASYLHPVQPTYLVFVQVEGRFSATHHQAYHRCHVGLNHLAFHMPTTQAIDDLTKELIDRGVSMLYQDRYPYAGGQDYYAAFFEDPDRIKLEITLTPSAYED